MVHEYPGKIQRIKLLVIKIYYMHRITYPGFYYLFVSVEFVNSDLIGVKLLEIRSVICFIISPLLLLLYLSVILLVNRIKKSDELCFTNIMTEFLVLT